MFLFILIFYLFFVVFVHLDPIHLPVSSYPPSALPCQLPPVPTNNKIRERRKKVNKMENVVLEAALWHSESHNIPVSPSIYLYFQVFTALSSATLSILGPQWNFS